MSELYCPKCDSDKLTANAKGFSAGKAIVGGVLTGGVGLLAGFHGKGKVIITCLACGNKFKPGEGNVTAPRTQEQIEASLPDEILNIAKTEGFNKAVTHYSKIKKVGFSIAYNEVDKIASEHNPTTIAMNQVKSGDYTGCIVFSIIAIGIIAFVILLMTGSN